MYTRMPILCTAGRGRTPFRSHHSAMCACVCVECTKDRTPRAPAVYYVIESRNKGTAMYVGRVEM